MKALIVESSSTMRSVLRRILSMRCFEVAEAGNGSQAMEALSTIGAADLVLVSWIPRERDGLDFITCLRRRAAHRSARSPEGAQGWSQRLPDETFHIDADR